MTTKTVTTYSGKCFDLLADESSMIAQIHELDIAVSLSRIPRFNGHTVRFYSVAQHSVHVCDMVMSRTKDFNAALAALLHDAQEAYLGDIISPIKEHLNNAVFPNGKTFKELECFIQACILKRFGVYEDYLQHERVIKYFDLVALATEKRDLLDNNPKTKWIKLPDPHSYILTPAPAELAEQMFLARIKGER